MWVNVDFDNNFIQVGPSKQERISELQKMMSNINTEIKRIQTSTVGH